MYNVYNKGFLIRIKSKIRRIISQDTYEQGRCRYSVQDRSYEFITPITCVSALGKKLLATLLYKGKSRDLQDTWVGDLQEQDDVFFRVIENR